MTDGELERLVRKAYRGRETIVSYPQQTLRLTNDGGPWGLLDTVDQVWLGNDTGPATFAEHNLARLAAAVTNERLGYTGRIQAVAYTPEPLRLRDKVAPQCSAEEAIIRLETGRTGGGI